MTAMFLAVSGFFIALKASNILKKATTDEDKKLSLLYNFVAIVLSGLALYINGG